MQEYLVFPEENCFKLPKQVSTIEGALIEPLAVGLYAAEHSEVKINDTIVILGMGCIGLMTLIACKARNVGKIISVDIYDTHLEIAKKLGLKKDQVERVLSGLKLLEPRGIFASGLEECLLLQIQGMEQEEALKRVIKDHLQDVAEGRISSISRDLKLSSAEVRKLIHIIKELNPRPLNGYGEAEAQYILPDIILTCQNGQWNMELNDKWTGNVQINEFYVHMMETAQDEELKSYFEEKLRRARFIMNAVDQRRRTLLGITEGILKRQPGYLLGTEHLKPMTLEELAEELGVHKSTVSRAIRDKYLLAPGGCFLLRDLFTSGIASGDGKTDEVSRTAVKAKLRKLVEAEDKGRPYSDEQLARLLERDGMPVSRRTVAKYRMELGLGSAFQRREE